MRLPVLAESPRFVVAHEFEIAYLIEKATGKRYHMGDHYGDPRCALISPNEDWVVVGGEGLRLFDFTGEVYEYLRHFSNEPENDLHVTYSDGSGIVHTLEGVAPRETHPVFIEKLSLFSTSDVGVFPDRKSHKPTWLLNATQRRLRQVRKYV
jgi:hypothetical protein